MNGQCVGLYNSIQNVIMLQLEINFATNLRIRMVLVAVALSTAHSQLHWERSFDSISCCFQARVFLMFWLFCECKCSRACHADVKISVIINLYKKNSLFLAFYSVISNDLHIWLTVTI